MSRYLSSAQIAEFKECFELYDKQHLGNIKGGDLVPCMRSLGMAPTIAEGKEYLKKRGIRSFEHITFDAFLEIIHIHLNKEKPTKEIQKAFKLTDKKKLGFIGAQDLRHILTHTGERLSGREVDQMFRAANIQPGGFVKYEDFIRMVTMPLPEV